MSTRTTGGGTMLVTVLNEVPLFSHCWSIDAASDGGDVRAGADDPFVDVILGCVCASFVRRVVVEVVRRVVRSLRWTARSRRSTAFSASSTRAAGLGRSVCDTVLDGGRRTRVRVGTVLAAERPGRPAPGARTRLRATRGVPSDADTAVASVAVGVWLAGSWSRVLAGVAAARWVPLEGTTDGVASDNGSSLVRAGITDVRLGAIRGPVAIPCSTRFWCSGH